ncbi:hypothetical protein NDU88_007679 [Pleurodeles waltl]|uniref:Uncharacterized protein n=1 Tax=Pleurodeles waltl TaxID=8319 RepID=A0AAV7RVK0_PLEWA|nr:hypothetical protein NDU88_007679 [Pleurodeles waltl]
MGGIMRRGHVGSILDWLLCKETGGHAILQIEDFSDRLMFTQEDIHAVILHCYRLLYDADAEIDESEVLRYIADSSTLMLDPAVTECLRAEITVQELWGVIKEMARSKVPGTDGVLLCLFQL